MRIALILTIAAGFSFGLVAGTTALVGLGPPPAPAPTAVVWADRVFTSRHDLAAWLEARGSNYGVWAVRHPALARTFDVRPGETTAVGLESQTPRAVRPDRSRSILLFVIASVVLATVIAVVASRRSRRFAGRGGMGLRNMRRRIPLGAFGARATSAVHSKAPRTAVAASRKASSALASRTLGASRRVSPRTVARDQWAPALTGLRRAGATTRYGAARTLSNARGRGSFSEVAWYATSALIAFAVGACVAFYLK